MELGIKGLPEDITQMALRGQVGIYRRTLLRDSSVDAPDAPELDAIVTTLWARHHFGEGWSAELSVPTGLVELRSASGLPVRVSGLGDLSFGGRYDFGALWGLEGRRPSLAFHPRLSLPTAALATTSPSPDVPPTLLALGDGVFGAGLGATLTQPLGEGFVLALPAAVQIPLTRASNRRQPGLTYLAAFDLLYQPIPGLTLRAGASYESRGYADEQGPGTILNSGGTWLRAQGGITGVVAKRVVLGAGARAPFYARVHGRQLVESVTIDATVGVIFGVEDEKDDGHEHDHGHDDHDDDHASGGDVEDLAVGGDDFALADAVVPGKLVVIDFWADWCHPCEHLDAGLRKLAAEHDDLAVRRVEIIDFEQPVGQTWFPEGGALPQLWILDGDTVEQRLVGIPPDDMVEAVRQRLED